MLHNMTPDIIVKQRKEMTSLSSAQFGFTPLFPNIWTILAGETMLPTRKSTAASDTSSWLDLDLSFLYLENKISMSRLNTDAVKEMEQR